MATLWKTYADTDEARRAVEALMTVGVPARDLRLLTRTSLHDVRNEPVGEFGRPADPNDPVGTFANVRRLRRQGRGSFAGDPDRQRQGSFADADCGLIVTYERGARRWQVAGDRLIRRDLEDAGLDEAEADRIVHELHARHAVLVAEISEITPAQAAALLDGADWAA
jgi:hypothetical protein